MTTEEADPMYGGMSQMELFFRFGKDIRIREEDGKIIISARFQVDPDSKWIGYYGSNG